MAIKASDYVESGEACKLAGVTYPTMKRCLEKKELLARVPKGVAPRLIRGVPGSRGGRKAYWHIKFVEAVKELYYAFA